MRHTDLPAQTPSSCTAVLLALALVVALVSGKKAAAVTLSGVHLAITDSQGSTVTDAKYVHGELFQHQ